MSKGKTWERAILIARYFDLDTLQKIGQELGVDITGIDGDIGRWKVAMKIAKSCNDEQLKELWKYHILPSIEVFRGRWYTVTRDGVFLIESTEDKVREDLERALEQGGSKAYAFLKALVELGGTAKFKEITRKMETILKESVWPTFTLNILRKYDLIFETGSRENPMKAIPPEILPIVKQALSEYKEEFKQMWEREEKKQELSTELAREEVQKVERMDAKLQEYLQELNIQEIKSFGSDLTIVELEEKFRDFFGRTFMDPLLSLIQQYSICDASILSPSFKRTRLKTGFNLAFFGDPGTGKTFASVDIIKGSEVVPAFGIPGRNRYCSGMTPAAFIRIAEAYEGKRFNFLVPEFREWFTHSSSMAEYLKLALERKPIKYETARNTVNSYEFTSFFNVNYNVSIGDTAWSSLSRDPHFRALRDRLLCKLHRMTMDRYKAISDSQMELLMRGKEEMEAFAHKIRDHLTLIFAVENGLHDSDIPKKRIKLKAEFLKRLRQVRNEILSEVEQPPFSPRLEKRVLQIACSIALLEYFHSDEPIITVSEAAYNFAEKVFKKEVQTRMRERL